MPQLEAITKTAYEGKYWRTSPNYAFAGHDAMAVLVMQEVTRACMSLPLAFAAVGEHYSVVAVQGLKQGQNLFVAPDGRWLGQYIPAVYRAYPFALANTQDQQQVLCFDRASGLLGIAAPQDASAQGLVAFYDAGGEPSQRTRQILQFLTQVQANREPTQRLCDALQQHNLIQPWEIQVQAGESTQKVQGLFRIDEAALNAMAPADFEVLRQSGALPLVYCQLLSMQHLQRLGALARAHAQAQSAALPETPSGDLDLEFLNSGGTIKFH